MWNASLSGGNKGLGV
uniref:Uncharacterized protein n=1 Tax=Rhizophora mucronata TaxID=61149 RepID=A0A2P2R406_RHIMU